MFCEEIPTKRATLNPNKMLAQFLTCIQRNLCNGSVRDQRRFLETDSNAMIQTCFRSKNACIANIALSLVGYQLEYK